MANKMIYIQDNLLERLKDIENLSGLIQELLIKYLESRNSKQSEFLELQKELEEKNNRFKQLQIELEEKRLLKEQMEEQLLNNPLAIKEEEERWERIKKIQRQVINLYEIDESEKDSHLNNLIDQIKSGEVKNIIEYMNNNNISKKQKRVSED